MVCPSFWEDYCMLIYTHCWELMNSVGSHGSWSLLFVMKVMVCHLVSDSHEVMTALIVMLPLIVVVENSCNFIKLYCFLGRNIFDCFGHNWQCEESHDHPHLSCSCVVYCTIQETLVVKFAWEFEE
jgi:hypothetical protein